MSKKLATATAVCALVASVGASALAGTLNGVQIGGRVSRVLVISIDGMHAIDFANCSKGLPSVNGGEPYCPFLASLADTGYLYTEASTSRPSDSFPGLTALATGGSPHSAGAYYDVSYNRELSPPAKTTAYGIPGGANLCPGVVGTQVGYDEQVDIDYTKLDAGGGVNPDYLPRDPKNGCAPVYPHAYLKDNTMFEVVRANAGYTAWADKHPSYEIVKGLSGRSKHTKRGAARRDQVRRRRDGGGAGGEGAA